MTNNSNESNNYPVAESNNDYDISMDIETRIAELRTCPVWEDHVRMLEDLLRKADKVASKYYNDDVETTLKLQKAEARVDKLKEIAEGLAYTGCPIHRGYWKSKLREPLNKPLR